MKRASDTVVLAYDAKERVYNVSVPALPGCLTWGRTKPQDLARAREAIEGYLEVLRDFGDPIPREGTLRSFIAQAGLSVERFNELL